VKILALSSEQSQFSGTVRIPKIRVLLQNPGFIGDVAEPFSGLAKKFDRVSVPTDSLPRHGGLEHPSPGEIET
jgi:hypothetical protein